MNKTIIIAISLIMPSALLMQAQENRKSIIAINATVEQVGSGFSFTEGPTADKDGRVYFTDQPNDRIYVWDENEGISLWLEGTGRSNGMYFDSEYRLFICADEKNELAYFDENKNLITLCDSYNHKHLNGPNDVWVSPNGGIYFTDPYYHRKWWGENHKEIQDVRGTYYLSANGKLSLEINDLNTPNGLVGTPDGKTLYVADIKDGKTWKYDINIDGKLTNKTFFAPKGSDGMTIDNEGNIYLTSGKVWVYNPKGELIEEIEFPESPSNVCFGGKDRNILFVTARKGVYTLKMNVKGVN